MKPKKAALVEKDLVLISIEDKPAFYARVENITPDVKPEWWRVQFLMLTLPAQMVSWIIDDEQIRGADFTIGGTPIRIEKLVVPDNSEKSPADRGEPQEQADTGQKGKHKARVLSLGNKNKNKEG